MQGCSEDPQCVVVDAQCSKYGGRVKDDDVPAVERSAECDGPGEPDALGDLGAGLVAEQVLDFEGVFGVEFL